ncbi:hypothetical protein OG906_43065 (plasmid) [Streptomyces sp. NBC_01426]|uniref:hypothetical protein n=1 Tax=Streptomyces sp. NBC_01426 TaxID=2975866 RepID=UPI002E34C3CB|nr:hypothetical protein [Streptomyces sp. NBC_01426]
MRGDGHVEHPLIGRLVRDRHSGTEGRLMAVVREDVPTLTGPRRTTKRAYIRPTGGGREITTAVNEIEPLGTL